MCGNGFASDFLRYTPCNNPIGNQMINSLLSAQIYSGVRSIQMIYLSKISNAKVQ